MDEETEEDGVKRGDASLRRLSASIRQLDLSRGTHRRRSFPRAVVQMPEMRQSLRHDPLGRRPFEPRPRSSRRRYRASVFLRPGQMVEHDSEGRLDREIHEKHALVQLDAFEIFAEISNSIQLVFGEKIESFRQQRNHVGDG